MLVHGGASDGRAWQPQIAALSDEFTVVAWDEPGAGGSDDVPPDFTLRDYANTLAALIEQLELGPASVAGLSWGGTVVLELYRTRPDLVAKLVFADTYAGWRGSLDADEVQARITSVLESMEAPRGDSDPLPGWFAGPEPAEFASLLDAMAADRRPESLRVAMTAMAEADQRDVLPAIDVPTLLIWGDGDVRSPLTIAREFERAIPGAKLVVLRGSGHVSNLERPREFSEAVRSFCREPQLPVA